MRKQVYNIIFFHVVYHAQCIKAIRNHTGLVMQYKQKRQFLIYNAQPRATGIGV